MNHEDVNLYHWNGRSALRPHEIAEALDGVVDPSDLASPEALGLAGRQADLLGKADRLILARERLGLGIGVPAVRLEALAQLTGDLMRILAAKRPKDFEEWRRRRGLPHPNA